MSNGNALNAILTNLNQVFLNENIGADSPTAGSSIIPYKNMAYSLSKITTASVTNPFINKILSGQITDVAGQIKLKPYVSINGDSTFGTIINNSSDIEVDVAAWQANLSEGFLTLQNCLILGNVNLDFSSVTLTDIPTIKFSDILVLGSFSILGTTNLVPKIQIYNSFLNGAFFDNCNVEKSNGNSYEDVKLGSVSLAASNSFESTGDTISSFTGISPSSGIITGKYKFASMLGLETLSLDGANTNLTTDNSSIYGINPISSCTNGAIINYSDGNYIIRGLTQSAILAITPSDIIYAFSIDTKQLFFWNTTDWVISA